MEDTKLAERLPQYAEIAASLKAVTKTDSKLPDKNSQLHDTSSKLSESCVSSAPKKAEVWRKTYVCCLAKDKDSPSGSRLLSMVCSFGKDCTVSDAVHKVDKHLDMLFLKVYKGKFTVYLAKDEMCDVIIDQDINVHSLVVPGTALMICLSATHPDVLYERELEYYFRKRVKRYFVLSLLFVLAVKLFWTILMFRISDWIG